MFLTLPLLLAVHLASYQQYGCKRKQNNTTGSWPSKSGWECFFALVVAAQTRRTPVNICTPTKYSLIIAANEIVSADTVTMMTIGVKWSRRLGTKTTISNREISQGFANLSWHIMTSIFHPPASSSSPVDPATPNPDPYFSRNSVGGKGDSCVEPILLVRVRVRLS